MTDGADHDVEANTVIIHCHAHQDHAVKAILVITHVVQVELVRDAPVQTAAVAFRPLQGHHRIAQPILLHLVIRPNQSVTVSIKTIGHALIRSPSNRYVVFFLFFFFLSMLTKTMVHQF